MIISKVYISDLGYLMVTVESNGVQCNHIAGVLRDMLPEQIAKLPIKTTSGTILNSLKNETKKDIAL